MAAPGARMRLTVEILPLVAENAHGPHRAATLAAFKGRKFALPVQLEHTFEQVWRQIEERYKRNYLSPVQALSFTIKKLQDAYDCDLDISDTVGSIFEGENDAQMRVIKVVPSFVNRDFSMPVTSNLRPAAAQKRIREINEEHASKRRRLEEEHQELMDMDPVRDQPVASTESEHSGDENAERIDARTGRGKDRTRRSKSGSSLVFVQGTQTGDQEFGTQIKEESPELGLPLSRTIPESPTHTFKKPILPASKMPPTARQHTCSPTRTPQRKQKEALNQHSVAREKRLQDTPQNTMEDEDAQTWLGPTPSPPADPEETAIHESPRSIPDQGGTVVEYTASRQRSLTSPSSPPFMRSSAKKPKTYSRPKKTPSSVQRDVNLLNNSRPHSTSSENESGRPRTPRVPLSSKARSFQVSIPDEIESTPQRNGVSKSRSDLWAQDKVAEDAENNTSFRERSASSKSSKSGGLKKPSQKSFLLENLGVSATTKAIQTPKRKRGRPRKSDATSFSASAKSSTTQHVSPEGRSGSESIGRTVARRPSPKVMIPLRSPVTRARTNSTSEEIPEVSASNPIVNGVSSNESPEYATNPSAETRKAVQKKALAGLTNESTAEQSSVTRRTPVHVPANVRLTDRKSTPQSDTRTTPVDDSQTSEVSVQSSRGTATKATTNKKAVTDDNTSMAIEKEQPIARDIYALPDEEEMTVAPESKASVRSASDVASSGSIRLKSQVPLPANVKHLSGAPIEAVKAFHALPAKVVNRNRQLSKSASVDRESPAPPKRLGRPPKNADSSLSKVRQKLSPETSKSAAPVTHPAVAPSTNRKGGEDAVVLSSGDSSSDYSPSEDSEEDQVVQIINKDKSKSSRDFSFGPKLTSSAEKKHNGIMKKIFPAGHEETMRELDYATQMFGRVPQNLDADNEEESAHVPDDAGSLHDSDANRQLVAEDLESKLQKASEAESPRLDGGQHNNEKAALKSAPWNSESWEFGTVNGVNGTADEADEDMASALRSNPPSSSGSEGTSESELEAKEKSGSKSASAVSSARSSPEVSRQPARYLSHSPTPENSSSEEGSVTSRSRSRSRAESLETASDSEESDSDASTDGSSSSESDSESEDEDVEMEDADPPSSPPELPAEPVTVVPATQSSQPRIPQSSLSSQPLARKSQFSRLPSFSTPTIPASQTPTGSSQSVSQLAAARRARQAAYSKFPSIRQQLTAARANSSSTQPGKKFDPRTSSLGKLAQKNGGKKGKVFDMSESSSDDSSSESSSDDDDGKGKVNGGACSVA